MRNFIKICKKPQEELKNWLNGELKKYYKKNSIVNEDGFLLAKGTVPILLTAHMDTVHKEQCSKKNIWTYKKNDKHYVTSSKGIGGDDRCGVWLILEVLKQTDFRPTILFCEDEETGGIGSNKFVGTDYLEDILDMKYMIELDRANANDAVFYDCGNKEFQTYICEQTGYKDAWGSFSDISHLSPATDIASVNLSCGYYNAHTTKEYVVMEEMETTLAMVCKLLKDEPNVEQFDYQENKYSYGNYGLFGGYGDYECYGSYYGKRKSYGYDNYSLGYDEGYEAGYDDGVRVGWQRKVNKENESVYCVEYEFEKETHKDTMLASSDNEALGIFMKIHDELCYKDVVSVWKVTTESEDENVGETKVGAYVVNNKESKTEDDGNEELPFNEVDNDIDAEEKAYYEYVEAMPCD